MISIDERILQFYSLLKINLEHQLCKNLLNSRSRPRQVSRWIQWINRVLSSKLHSPKLLSKTNKLKKLRELLIKEKQVLEVLKVLTIILITLILLWEILREERQLIQVWALNQTLARLLARKVKCLQLTNLVRLIQLAICPLNQV